MNHNYIRPGGVAADLPDGWRDDVAAICETIPRRLDEYDSILTGQPIFQQRQQGVGPLSADQAIALGVTGPLLRAAGVAWDLRRDMPYLAYDEVDFDVIVGTYGDCWDRYAVRLNETRESVRIVRQILDCMPPGDYRIQDRKLTPPPRSRIDESMEALIHHFKLFTEGFKVPAGETYVGIESPEGSSAATWSPTVPTSPTACISGGPRSSTCRPCRRCCAAGSSPMRWPVISTVDPVLGDVDR